MSRPGDGGPGSPGADGVAGRRPQVVLYNPLAPHFQMPLGLLVVGSALARDGFVVRLLDGRLARPRRRALSDLLRGTSFAGAGVLSGGPILDALRFSRLVREVAPRVPVVWGGWHPSLLPEQCLEEPAVDYVLRGPAEEAAVRLAHALEGGRGLEEVPGLTCRRPDGKGWMASAVELPAALPPLDFDLLDVETYFRRRRSRTLDYVTSQGCPFGCAFCSDPAVYHRRWRGRPVEEVTDDLARHAARLRLQRVAFLDDMFHLLPERTAAIAEGLVRLPAPLRWSASFRASQLAAMEEDLLSLLVRSGLDEVVVGAESGSDRLLASISKDLTVGQILRAAGRLRRHGVRPYFSFIAGLPGEAAADRRATEDLVLRLREEHPGSVTRLFFHTPYPGSRLTAEMAAEGRPLPATLEEWGRCDFFSARYTGILGPREAARVDRLNFYTHYARLDVPALHPLRPLASLARWRCRTRRLGLPLEMALLALRRRPEG